VAVARFLRDFDARLAQKTARWAEKQDIYVMFVKQPLLCEIKEKGRETERIV
jgi:hypothetical protein